MNGNAVLAGLGQGLQTFGLLKQAQIQDTAAQRKEERQFNLDKEKLDIMRESAASERTAAKARLEELRRQGDIAAEKLGLEREKVGLMGRENITVKNTEEVPVTDENGNPVLDDLGRPKYVTRTTERVVPKYGQQETFQSEAPPPPPPGAATPPPAATVPPPAATTTPPPGATTPPAANPPAPKAKPGNPILQQLSNSGALRTPEGTKSTYEQLDRQLKTMNPADSPEAYQAMQEAHYELQRMLREDWQIPG